MTFSPCGFLASAIQRSFFLSNLTLFTDPLYYWSYVRSLEIATVSTVILLLTGYPVAYAMARAPRRLQGMLVMLIILPFFTSFHAM